MTMIQKLVTKLLSRLRKARSPAIGLPEDAQVALPRRADLPLRDRSRSLVAIPAQINGARMGTGKL